MPINLTFGYPGSSPLTPICATFELTSRCNLDCKMCYVRLTPAEMEPLGRELTANEWLELAQQAKDAGMVFLLLTGGEPTLQPELPHFLKSIKEQGFLVKLDTNGYRPEVLQSLVEAGLVDYVAMDVKNGPSHYAATTGHPGIVLDRITQSLRFLIASDVPYELRTTVVKELHSEDSILEMGRWLAALVPGKLPKVLYLQSFVDRESVLFSGLSAPESALVEQYRDILAAFAEEVTIRN